MMFDFQTLRYSSPMVDLVTFMANSTGTDVRSTHFSFIFKTYHEEVIKTLMFTLKKFRHEISDVYRFVVTMSVASFAFNLSSSSSATIISFGNMLVSPSTDTLSQRIFCKSSTIPKKLTS